MSEPTGVSTQSPSDARSRREVQVWAAVTAGVASAVVAAMIGVAMAMQRRERECPDGTYFPEGTTDFRCFTHPQGLEGSAVALISIALGVLVVLVGMLVRSTSTEHDGDSTD